MTEQDRQQGGLSRIGSLRLLVFTVPELGRWQDVRVVNSGPAPAEDRARTGLGAPPQRQCSGHSLLVGSALYCFGIGRDRYTSVSEFVIKQPMPPSATGSVLLGGTAMSTSVLASLEDGRYLQSYLKSSDVKQSVFPDPNVFKARYAPVAPDGWSGLSPDAVEQDQLAFFKGNSRLFLRKCPEPLCSPRMLTRPRMRLI